MTDTLCDIVKQSMRAFRQQLFGEWGFLALLALLCAGLTWLQFRWTGEISRAEAERLRGGVRETF